MKRFFLSTFLVIWSVAPAIADTWECVDSGDGHVYKATQSVPVDRCKQVAWTPESEEKKKIRAIMNTPLSQRTTTVQIGMSRMGAMLSNWGNPEKINKTTTASGVREQWVYGEGRYLYFENGVLTAIQD